MIPADKVHLYSFTSHFNPMNGGIVSLRWRNNISADVKFGFLPRQHTIAVSINIIKYCNEFSLCFNLLNKAVSIFVVSAITAN